MAEITIKIDSNDPEEIAAIFDAIRRTSKVKSMPGRVIHTISATHHGEIDFYIGDKGRRRPMGRTIQPRQGPQTNPAPQGVEKQGRVSDGEDND